MHSQPYKYFDRLQVTKRKTKKKKKQESYVKFATKLTVRSKLDVNAFVKAKPDQVQRLLHRTVILRCHCALVPVRPLQPQKQQGFNEGETNPKTQGTRMRINERERERCALGFVCSFRVWFGSLFFRLFLGFEAKLRVQGLLGHS